jgi:hypothetical protein
MIVQPFAAYCLVNSRPMPEFAPVIITVSANAASGATAQVPASAAAKTVSDHRIFANIMFPSDIRRMPLRRRVG